MIVSGLQISRFGSWSQLTLQHLPHDLLVLVGGNETGKTTLLRFVRSMFFGYGDREVQDGLLAGYGPGTPMAANLRLGGSLTLLADGAEYQLRRHLGDGVMAHSNAGEVQLIGPRQERVAADRLQYLLGGVDEPLFRQIFAVGLGDLQDLSALAQTPAAGLLYDLALGNDQVSLVEVMRHLQAVQRQDLGQGWTDLQSDLGQLYQRRQQLSKELADCSSERENWIVVRAELDALRQQVAAVTARRDEQRKQLDWAVQIVELGKDWDERESLRKQLAELPPAADIPASLIQTLDRIDTRLTRLRADRSRLDDQAGALVKQRQELEQSLPPLRQRITAHGLVEQQFRIHALTEQRARLHDQWAGLESAIQLEQQQLGLTASAGPSAPRSAAQIEPDKLLVLLEPARQLQHAQDRLDQANNELTQQQQQQDQVEAEVSAVLRDEPDLFDDQDAADLIHAVRKTGTIAAALRHQVDLVRRQRACRQQLADLQSRRADHFRNQLLPRDVVLPLGAVFTAGAFLVQLAFFGPWWNLGHATRVGLMIIGGAAVALASVIKILLDHAARDDLAELERSSQQVRAEWRRIMDRRKELQSGQTPRHGRRLRVTDAEQRLARLESLLPLESRRRTIRQLIARGEEDVARLVREQEQSLEDWKRAVQRTGLSHSISPDQLRNVVDNLGRLNRLRAEMHQLSQTRADVDRHWDHCREQITSCAALDAPSPDLPDTASMMRHLEKHVAQWDEQAHRIQQLHRQEELLRAKEVRYQNRVRELEHRKRRLVADRGAIDVEDLRRRHVAAQERQQVTARIAQLEATLRCQLQGVDENAWVRRLREQSASQRLAACEQNRAQLQALEKQLAELQQRQSDLMQQIERLVLQAKAHHLRFQQALVDERIRSTLERWRLTTTIRVLLKSVYGKYENDRQPEVLRQASNWFAQLSLGQYSRIWTPLGEDTLRVDTAQGTTRSLSQLSCGTRDQALLSLRLALAAAYAKRGIRLPLILDDVLVNFDVAHTQAAAAVLRQFAQQGHQVIVLTCHNHVAAAFRMVSADVRELSPGITDQPPLPSSGRRSVPSSPTRGAENGSRDPRRILLGAM